MTVAKTSWDEVRDGLSQLGLKLQLHFEQAAEDGRPSDEHEVKEALRSIGDAVDQAFTALGNAATDEAVREDARDLGQAVAEALDATFAELGERFRSSVKRD